ncbi:NAD(P)-dependent oxidoreductase [Aureispira sp. CCB-QB1]|uniref:NAD(P)-dependent oxidoreductase n=1 Tax=Aureispira sp. CCB-QB1 TaxID=1313421 RepID=UPI0006975109|nr:NAD(P)-dependent oxidoreductase [Aureispira sp. CCB-QB1]
MKIGIIREGKVPPDSRVLFTPKQCATLQEKYDLQFVVQPSPGRCLPDEAYESEGIKVQEDVSDCDVLMGIKEVPKEQLIPNKKYFFFSHTIKAQPYNRALLQKILEENITLFDYEVLTNEKKQRVIAFGRFAGIVGAHNGMMTYGNRTGAFELKQMHKYDDYAAAIAYYKTLSFPKMKIVVTGTGRVANGAAEVFDHMEIRKVSPQDFLEKEYDEAVYTQLDCEHYAAPKEDKPFELMDFYQNPQNYKSIFEPYTKVADLMVNGIYWANEAPAFFTKAAMKEEDFNIKVIADVTCDIAPVASIPSTLFATTIAKPVFGYDPESESAVEPYQAHTIDMMTIDNLPNELPKDASKSFGEQFTAHVIEELLGLKNTGMLERAMIAKDGQLGPHFQYLTDYVQGA